jgi:hypothetical protein
MNGRPVFVLFGSSIVQYSFSNGGWGATLADIYARKVLPLTNSPLLPPPPPVNCCVVWDF